MWRHAAWLGAVMVLLGLGGWPGLAAAAPASQPPTQVRVLNALPSAPAVDVAVDGESRVPALAFGADPPYITLPPGPHTIALLPPGGVPPDPLVSMELTVPPGSSQTLFAIQGEGVPPIFLVLPEVPAGLPGEGAAARFVHASPNTPPVDLALQGGPVLFGNIAFGEASPYVPVNAGTVDLEARLAGTDTVVLDIPAVELAPGGVYTFGALGLTDGAPPLGFLSLSDL
ncbi:MAG TPA: DUF4397 domain-containing protein [Chloroflexota bacterium]|nr:DUF4397 domain-containing protein [Chloroflexota bacterium]